METIILPETTTIKNGIIYFDELTFILLPETTTIKIDLNFVNPYYNIINYNLVLA